MSERVTITAVEAHPVVVSGKRDFRISEGQTRVHTSVVLRILTDREELEGIGEIVSAPPGKPEELADEIVGAVRHYLAPTLVGMAASGRARANAAVARILKGRNWTKAGLNVALYDLHAKMLGVPVTDLLGGRAADRVPVIGPVIGIMQPEEMARQAEDEVAAGFKAVKIKVGETPTADIARVAAVREAIGDRAALRVDANDHYQPADAIRLARAIEKYDIEHLEQPVSRSDLLGMAEVRDKIGIPLMTDDAVATPEEAMNVIRLKAADRVKVKVSKHGLDGARLLTEMLGAAGIRCVLGHVFEMGLAAVAEAHFAACAENLAPPHEIGSMQPMGSSIDVITADLRSEAGYITLPDGPGLGVALDEGTVRPGRSEAAE